MQQISVRTLADWLAAASRNERSKPLMVDVREPWEVDICRIEGALTLPMAAVPSRLQELDPDAETVAIDPATGHRLGASDLRKPDSLSVGY